MKPLDYFVNLVLSTILIVGTYQFYFLTQRYQLSKVRTFNFKIDEKLPYWPTWAWIYSFLYYPAILYLNWLAQDARQFTMMAFSYILLLLMQMTFFYIYPVATPEHWRDFNKGNTASERFLKIVHKYDAPTNCFPSMHVSVAMLTALHALGQLGEAVYAFPVLIGLSCIFTKQHYVIDLPLGAFLGWVAYQGFVFLT
jgi:membrane-associated phospholipid phosphatase